MDLEKLPDQLVIARMMRLGGHTSADVETNVKTLRSVGNGVVVSLQVCVEQFVRVNTLIPQRLKHLVGAEVGESRVVNLDIANTLIVQSLELLAVSLGEIREEVLVVGVSLRGVALARGKSQVEVARRRHSELALSPLLLRNTLAKHLPVLEVRALLVLNLALAESSHGVLLAGLLKRSDRRRRKAHDIPRNGLYLAKTTETLKETGEVVLAIKLAGGNSANAMLLLLLDDIGDSSLLRGDELIS